MWAVLETWKVRDVSIEPQLVPEVAQHQLEMVVIGWVHCSGSRLLEGAALWRCSEVLELVASKWLPVAREWSLWWLLLHLPWEQMSRPPWSLGGIRQELPCGGQVLLRNVLLWLFDLRATHKMPTSSQWLASQGAKGFSQMTSCYWQICFSDLIMRPTLHTSVSTGLWSHSLNVDPLSF